MPATNTAHAARSCTCHIAPATRADYLAGFHTTSDAIAFENAALSCGRKFLPREAQAVLDGKDPTPAYWCWLIGQSEAA